MLKYRKDLLIVFISFFISIYCADNYHFLYLIICPVTFYIYKIKPIFYLLFCFCILFYFPLYLQKVNAKNVTNYYIRDNVNVERLNFKRNVAFVYNKTLNQNIYIISKDTLKDYRSYFLAGLLQEIKPNNIPGQFDNFTYLAQNQTYLMCFADSLRLDEKNNFKSNLFVKLNKMIEPFSNSFKGLYFACVFGNRSYLSPEDSKLFSLGGLSHFFSLSGWHISLFVFLLWAILKQFYLKFNLRFLALVILLGIFIYIIGMQAPIFRATLMALLFIYGREHEKTLDAYYLLYLTAIFNCILFPLDALTLSFWLSYLAMFGLFYGAERFNLLNKFFEFKDSFTIKDKLKIYLSSQFSPYFISLPIVFHFFSSISLSSFPNNLVVLPLLVFVLYGMLWMTFLSIFSLTLSTWVGHFLDALLSYSLSILDFFNSIQSIQNHGSYFLFLSILVLIFLIFHLYHPTLKKISINLIIAFLSLHLIFYFIKENTLYIHHLTIDNNQAFIIETPKKALIITDTFKQNFDWLKTISRLGLSDSLIVINADSSYKNLTQTNQYLLFDSLKTVKMISNKFIKKEYLFNSNKIAISLLDSSHFFKQSYTIKSVTYLDRTFTKDQESYSFFVYYNSNYYRVPQKLAFLFY